jgi:YVTN family beta-propeller protein
VGANPSYIATLGQKVYVTNSGTNTVPIIDTANSNAVSTITTDAGPSTILTNHTHVYIANGGSPGSVSDILASTTAAVLAPVTSIPSLITSSTQTFTYTAAFDFAIQQVFVTSCNPGVQVLVSRASSSTVNTVTLNNLQPGNTYQCSLYLTDETGNTSNRLLIGPFTYPAPILSQHVSGGTSITQQVKDLIEMGNTQEAKAIQSKWPNLFPASSSSPSVASTTTPMFGRLLKAGVTGPDVLALQQYLNSHGFPLASIGLGSRGHETDVFGPRTYNALLKFQEAHAADMLAPLHLAKGTGMLGPSTSTFIIAH